MAKWVDPLEDAEAEIKALRYMVECLGAKVQKAEAENERLRLALRIIAGYEQCLDNLMSNADVARAALGDTDEDPSA